MKKLILTLALVMGMTTQMLAMSTGTIRTNARFISDRMAYELDLTPMQYDDCYEINYDFIYMVSKIMNDVVYGYGDAIDIYYRLLDNRNDDLRYVLNSRQYAKFMALDYFYRPIYTVGKSWNFRIYTIYSNKTFFYYDAPRGYKTYNSGHSAINYYSNRYNHDIYNGNVRIYGTSHFQTAGRNDFGTVRRYRDDKQKSSINNYKNPNQPNRTHDSRYEDRSGNKNSPQINNRQNNDNKSHFGNGNRTGQANGNARR